jgi:hypothetical protein
MSPQAAFDGLIRVRRQIVQILWAQLEVCKQCESFATELSKVASHIEKNTSGLLQREPQEIDKIAKSNGHGHFGFWGNALADVLGDVSELYTFGLYKNARRGVMVKNYLPAALGMTRSEILDAFYDYRLDSNLFAKEIDLMTEDTWIEVKGYDFRSRDLWQKTVKQLKDHLELMVALTRGFRFQGRAGVRFVQQQLRMLRYYFVGNLSNFDRIELERESYDFQDELGVAPEDRIAVEFLSIPIGAN